MNTTTNNTNTEQRATFEQVKREFERAYAMGGDFSNQLYALSGAVAFSVLKKCIDPQRKTAVFRDEVSNNGQSPALLELYRGIMGDMHTLDNTRTTTNNATRIAYNDEGDAVTETADASAARALSQIIGCTLSDGIDLVQTAAMAILEQAAEHASGENWLDTPYNVRRLSRRVYIRMDDSAAYRDEETAPIREVYRAVRRAVQDSRAVQTDPRNVYTYIDAETPDGMDTIFYRLGKYADMGGDNSMGLYTVGSQTAKDAAALVERLELTARQAQVLNLRMQGKGYKAIATYLGVTQRAIAKTVGQIQKKAVAIGLVMDNAE